MALIRCPKCGNKVSEKASSCPHCGISLSKNLQKEKLKCPECSSELPDNATFCPNCGYPIRKENKKPINTKLFFVISGILVVTILGFIVLKVVTSKTKDQIQPSVTYPQSVQQDELMLENKNIVIDQEEAKKILANYLKVSVLDIYDVGYYNFGNDIRYVFTYTDDITPLGSQTDIFTVNAISGKILSVGKICRIEFYISPQSELSTSCENLRKPAKYIIVKGSLDGNDITYSISTNEGEILNCYRCSSSELNYEGEIKPNRGPFYIEAYNEALFNSKSLNLTIIFLYYKPSAMGDFGKQIDNLFF
jgi:predicted nucleic acid-binding Zn ribbon protein